MNEGHLFVVSGPSGAGKGTLCKMLLEKETGVSLSISMTTRNPRAGEANGKNYYFISREEFENKIEAGGFLEYAQVYGNYYGTPKQEILDALAKGTDIMLEIDTQGALQIKKRYPEAVLIFILPPSMGELRNRLIARGAENEEELRLRMSNAMTEMSFINEYDYYVVNADLFESLDRMTAIIMTKRSRVTQTLYDMIQKFKEEIVNVISINK
jgi:guanylate kinase